MLCNCLLNTHAYVAMYIHLILMHAHALILMHAHALHAYIVTFFNTHVYMLHEMFGIVTTNIYIYM